MSKARIAREQHEMVKQHHLKGSMSDHHFADDQADAFAASKSGISSSYDRMMAKLKGKTGGKYRRRRSRRKSRKKSRKSRRKRRKSRKKRKKSRRRRRRRR